MTATRARIDWAAMGRASADLVGHIVANSETLGRGAVRDFERLRRDFTEIAQRTRTDANNLGATVRATPRFLRIAATAAKALARHRIAAARAERLWSIDPEGSERAVAVMDSAHRANAIAARQLCTDLGGGLLKVGQLLSTRADLLPAAYVEELSTLQDAAPARPFEDIAEVITAELGASPDELFEHVEPEALAAASLAQVHAARLVDGREVAIKVQLPGVDDIVRSDITALSTILRNVGDQLPGLDIETTLSEVRRFLDEELDYEREAERMLEFAALADADERGHWRVPQPIRATRRVLVMERIHGRSLGETLVADDVGADDRRRILSLLVELLAEQILVHGVAHGDPHPGNIMIDTDGRLVLVDFGCVLDVPPSIRRAYIMLVMAITSRNRAGIASSLKAAGFSADDDDALVRLAELFLEAFEEDLADIDPAEQIQRATALAGEAGDIRVPRSFVLIGRIFALTGGVLMHHQPDVDLKTLLASTLARALGN